MLIKDINTPIGSLLFLLLIMHLGTGAYSNEINIAKYRVVTHSSSSDVNQCGHLVVDGSMDTYWESLINRRNRGPFKEWITIDLASPQMINSVKVHWGENFATEYKITLLGNSENVEKVIFQSTEGKGGNQKIEVGSLTAQYIRVDISNVKNPIRGCVIREIEVFGNSTNRFVPSEAKSVTGNSLSLNGNHWRVQNAMFVEDEPELVSSNGYNDLEWIPATVPGTVLGDYYNFGALPDPLYGDNMHQISDEFFSGNDFWYRTEVSFSNELSGKRLFIDFSGINWKSEIFFNGKYLGRIDGGFKRGEFEVTELVNFSGSNTVGVLVHHNDNWVSGSFKIIRKKLGDRTSNGDMLGLDGPTSLASAGWNWLPIIKGRNNGIWNNVTFRIGGNVSIKDPWVSSVLPLPDTTKADLTISTELLNQSSSSVEGTLIARFDNNVIRFPVQLQAHETKTVTLDKSQYSELRIKNPKLWWPNGYGQQHLTKLKLEFIENGKTSDSQEINFGIRQLEYKVVDGILFIHCNGYRIMLKGGNWGLPEAMMRLDSADYALRVQLHKEANFNMIRNWLGMTNREEFYDACDRNGILIFDDFWLANPKNGPNPNDIELFMDNARDKIKWVRKHPSLAFYCGRNEGLPLLEYDVAMKMETERLDGTRYYVPHSAAGELSGFGPYDVKSPGWYFENRGETFHSELGIIAIPEVESIRRMMPKENLWPINDMWAIHDYQYNRSFKYTDMMNERYGESGSVEEYSRKAQLQNYETGKAMFESHQSKQGSGIILWMSQSAWPSMICQLYDHYLEYTASYFAVKKAASPIHAFWDIHKKEIRVANNTKSELKNVKLVATIYDANGSEIWTKSLSDNVNSTSVKTFFDIEKEKGDKVLFLKLQLYQKKKLIADNFYWLENNAGNCLDLNDLPTTNVAVNVSGELKDGFYSASIKMENTSSNWSLLNKIKIKDKETGESILPVFFSDDYVSLLPGEEVSIMMKVEEKCLKNRKPELHLEGWNTKTNSIDLFKIMYP